MSKVVIRAYVVPWHGDTEKILWYAGPHENADVTYSTSAYDRRGELAAMQVSKDEVDGVVKLFIEFLEDRAFTVLDVEAVRMEDLKGGVADA